MEGIDGTQKNMASRQKKFGLGLEDFVHVFGKLTTPSQWTRMKILCWFFVGVITPHTYGFCIPLDFLGIKELRKNEKGQIFSKAIAKARDQF